uniref:C-type lectin domain-containing protein n=1 Tax=Anopheles farauti TaxID=69004 RepID=A0A182QJS9_9DIPT
MVSNILVLTICLAFFAIEAHGFKKYVAYNHIRRNFFTAWQTCRLYGGHLASIESAEENARVETAINAAGSINSNWFIGGTTIGIKGRYVWIGLNKEITSSSYQNWISGKPNTRLSNRCMIMGGAGGNQWNEVSCSSAAARFVCAFVS